MTKEAPAPRKTKQNSPHHLCSYASLCALQIKYAIAFSPLATYSWSVLTSEIQVPSFGVKGGPRVEAKAGLECRSLSTGVINWTSEPVGFTLSSLPKMS